MRVISGKFKGRKLFSPVNNATRPTTDQVKETIFNILGSLNAINGDALDLFCGSGALGIEALSRGVQSCIFADLSPLSVNLAKKNLAHVCADEETYSVYCADYQLALKKLCGKKFSLIFLDPPYAKGLEQKALDLLIKLELIAENGVIVCEHSLKFDLQICTEGFIIDKRTFGSTCVSFVQKRSEE